MAVSPDSKVLICTSETTSMVHFIDTTSRQIVANLLVGSRPRFSAFKSDGSELWVTSEIGGGSCDHRSGDTAAQANRQIRDSGTSVRGDPARRHQYHQGRQARLRRSRTRQSGGGGRRRHSRRPEIPAGRPKGLARRVFAGREISAGRQWRLERRLGHRRRGACGSSNPFRLENCPGALPSVPIEGSTDETDSAVSPTQTAIALRLRTLPGERQILRFSLPG